MPIRPRWTVAAVGLLAIPFPAAPAAAVAKSAAKPAAAAAAVDPLLLAGLEWREIGPYRGGRSAAVEGVPGDRSTYYFGSSGGGVWKTTDGGERWKNVSDGFFGGSIGAIAVSAWDPNVIYVGTGEATVRGNVSSGDGVWRSTDAGKSWTHVGLSESRHIPRLRIHPRDPDLVYAAALGHLFGANDERGVYRSADGGKNWQRVLFVDRDTGAFDLAMDPTNPRVLYATTWRVRRSPWGFESGGAGSGLWKTTDGGDTWKELTKNPGLPAGTLGVIGIAVSPTDPENLYASVEADEGGIFRSRDGGATWQRTNDERSLRQRAWYYSRLYADPKDAESVYVVNVSFHRSKDGGRTFSEIDTPHGDNHDLWIDPADPLRMIEANDGGANVSTDGGASWTSEDNQPTAQIYRVSTDDAFPWRILGAQQDNSALRIRSRSALGRAIDEHDWEETAGGESGHIVAEPGAPDVVYGGSYGGLLVRLDHRSGELRALNIWPDDPMGAGAGDQKFRFQWNYPLLFSPHAPHALYAAANVLFRSLDRGESWTAISGDLTRHDPTKLGPSGGPITKDNTSVEYYGTIFAVAESPLAAGTIWTGSDDGLVHVTRDGGASWANVSPRELPEWAMVNAIEPSPFEAGGAYLAATKYKLDDSSPQLFKTSDYGKSWTRIDADLPRDGFTRVVRADPTRRGLLFAGTERGIFVSFDDGARWQSLQRNLPIVPVTDLTVKDGELIAATQGRGFWGLDDLAPLRALAPGDRVENRLLAPRVSWRIGGSRREKPERAGKNPPPGVLFHYVLAEEPAAEVKVTLEILDAQGAVIRTYQRKPKPPGPEAAKNEKRDEIRGEGLRQLPSAKGANRFAWDLSYAPAEGFPGLILWNRDLAGPTALPGEYRARLTVGSWSATQPFSIVPDPRSTSTPEARRAQFGFLLAIRDELTAIHREIRKLREVRGQLEALGKRLGDAAETKELAAAAKALGEKLTAIEETLYQTKNKSPQDPLNFPVRLNDKLAGVMQLAALGDRAPTASMVAVRDELAGRADAELGKLRKVWAEDLPALNELARQAAVPLVAPTPEPAPQGS
ncbi:MAG: glycosyl hydrolase [Thermoanaerobaculia bacterium]